MKFPGQLHPKKSEPKNNNKIYIMSEAQDTPAAAAAAAAGPNTNERTQQEIDLLDVTKGFIDNEILSIYEDSDLVFLEEFAQERPHENIIKLFMIFYGSYKASMEHMMDVGFNLRGVYGNPKDETTLTLTTFEEKRRFIKGFIHDIMELFALNLDIDGLRNISLYKNLACLCKHFGFIREASDDLQGARQRLLSNKRKRREE
jgi:hypothetical protein